MGSARNLPATMAHVWRTVRRRSHGTLGAAEAAGAAKVASGLRYSASHRKSHRKPRGPVTTNAQRQPQFSAINGTMRGVSIETELVHALKMQVARGRSS